MAVKPEVIVADEPTSMLDVSVRLGVLNLLNEMKQEMNLGLLYITHDIATARYVAEDIAVMYAGQIVEWGSVAKVIDNPLHPYTRLLLSAVPDPDVKLRGQGGRAFQAKAEAIRAASRKASDEIVALGPNHFMRAVPDGVLRSPAPACGTAAGGARLRPRVPLAGPWRSFLCLSRLAGEVQGSRSETG